MIEENDAERSAIVFVNNSGSDVDEILSGQSGPKCKIVINIKNCQKSLSKDKNLIMR